MNILAIPGSFRTHSYNRTLLERIGSRFRTTDRFRVCVDTDQVPIFSEDLEDDTPPAVHSVWNQVRDAELVIFATPEYNQSLPGGLKNLLDWITRDPVGSPLERTMCVVVGATTGRWGTRIAQQQLRTVLSTCGGIVLPVSLFVADAGSKMPTNDVLDEFAVAVLSAAALAAV
jgi:chromate reductase